MRRFELALPSTVEECLAALADGNNGGGEVKMVAGGTDLLPQMKNGLVKPARVVDLSGIPELQKKNRATWWDKPQDLQAQEERAESKVPQPPYVYFPLPRAEKHDDQDSGKRLSTPSRPA